MNRAASELKRSGWRTCIELRTGEPLRGLIAAGSKAQAQRLVGEARGTSVLGHLLMGSGAESIFNQRPISVVLARSARRHLVESAKQHLGVN